MKNKLLNLLVYTFAILIFSSVSFAQSPPLLKRTTYKTEKIDFGAGGTLTIIGAPNGTITVEGWNKNEIEVSADVEVQAATEADLATLSQVDGFVLDEGVGHVQVLTVGTHDKDYMKRVGKKFPKNLLTAPFRIDYRIKVPTYCDLSINSGKGTLTLSKIEGTMQIRALEGDAKLDLIGGTIEAVFGTGNVDVMIGTRSWRGRHADISLAKGDLNVQVMPNMSADINATVLRTGKVENLFAALKPRDRSKFNEKSVIGRAGNGGALLSFTVGDGNLKIENF